MIKHIAVLLHSQCFILSPFIWADNGFGLYPFTGRDITHVNVEVVQCTKVSVDIFDPIYSNGILHPSGHIVKCYHEIYPDFDELRMVWIILWCSQTADLSVCLNFDLCCLACFLTAFA